MVNLELLHMSEAGSFDTNLMLCLGEGEKRKKEVGEENFSFFLQFTFAGKIDSRRKK